MSANWLRSSGWRFLRRQMDGGVRQLSSHSLDPVMESDNVMDSLPDLNALKRAVINPATLKDYIDPIIAADDYFKLNDAVSIEEMFEARVHYGHKVGTLKDNMKFAIFGERLDVCIFDLNITQKYMLKALKFLAAMSYQDGIFLFVSSNRSHILPVEHFARNIGQYAHTRKWQADTFSNSRAVFGAPIRLPDVVVFTSVLTSVLERHPAVIECAKLAIPTVAIVDSNAEPNYITYPIPGNDDSLTSLLYYLSMFHRAMDAGRRVRLAQDADYERRNRSRNQDRNRQKQHTPPPQR